MAVCYLDEHFNDVGLHLSSCLNDRGAPGFSCILLAFKVRLNPLSF